MKKDTEVKTRRCYTCKEFKPLDEEHWRHNKNFSSGFDRYCKLCAQKAIKAHYRRFTKFDKVIRGKVGVKCILWAPRCGVCPCRNESDLSACWRIAKLIPTSDKYPKGIIAETP
jgi:hypothetical protein